jgi:hypothetical protein
MKACTRTTMAGGFNRVREMISACLLASGFIGGMAQGQACDPPPASLVSWWPAEHNANDNAGTNGGVIQGGVTFVFGEVGQAFDFDGASGYVSIPASSSLNVGANGGFTIECWIKPNDLSTPQPLLEWNNGAGGFGPNFWINQSVAFGGGGPGSLYGNNTSAAIASASNLLSTTIFNHLAFTYDDFSGNAALFLNGTLVASQNIGSLTPATAYNVILGARPSASFFFNGLMDEMSVYNAALSSNQVFAIYSAGSAGKCPLRPVIVSQPQSTAVLVGNMASFSVGAVGSQPLSYQWRLNSTNISALTNTTATNATLVLTNVQLSQSGNAYSVVVTNSAGSTNSSTAFLNVSVPTCVSASTNLAGWWQGEGDAGDAALGNAGVIQGGVTFSTGEVGEAFNFDGVTGNIVVPASSTLNVGMNPGVTIEAWIKPASLASAEPLVEWNSANNNLGMHFWIDVSVANSGGGPGSFLANVVDTSGVNHFMASPGGLFSTNSFAHVAFTYDHASGVGTFYCNGLAVLARPLGVLTPRTTYNLNLGYRPGSPSFPATYYGGLLDEVSVYSVALSSNQIQAIYTAGSLGKCGTIPVFLSQPQSQSVSPGTNVTFFPGVSGTRPMTYQWKMNNSTVVGTNNSLTLANVQPGQAGTYSLFVSNALAPATSSNAVLKVVVMTVLGNGQPLTNAQYAFPGSVSVQLQNFYTNGDIFYTLDGSIPTFMASEYTGPFVVTNNAVIRALGYSSDFLEAGQSDPVSVVITPVYPLIATTAGGGTISLNPTNGSYSSNTVVTLKATPAPGWTFFQWLGDASGTNTNTTVTVTRNEFVQAVFGTTVNATVAPPGSGSVMFNPPGGLYPFGTTVLLSAVPRTGNYFALWGNAANGSGNTNPLPFALTSPNPTVSTLFSSLGVNQVALAVVPVGRGKVSLNPAGTVFTTGQMVTLTATPNQGQTFINWSGDAAGTQNPLQLTLNQSKTVFANFSSSNQLSFRPLSLRGLNEGFELTLTGEFGMPYRIDGSTNLSNWVPLITLTNTFGTMQYIDYGATNFPLRFYRGVPLP